MKKFIYILIAVAVAAVSCEKEANLIEEVVPGEEVTNPEVVSNLTNPITLTFTANASETKVSISGEGTSGEKTAVWDEGDQIKIVWYNSAESTMKSVVAIADSYGTASTTFTATLEEADHYYAVYPSALTVTLDGDEGEFTVNFPNNAAAPTAFKDAAWYAAKTTKADESFAFHPISTIIKFTLDGTAVANPEQIYFRSMNGGLHKLHGHAAITFADEAGYPLTAAANDGAANVTFNVAGAGTYYIPIPAYGETETTGTDGFIFQIKKSGESIPAAYYSATVTQKPGKFYNIKSAVDSKIIRNYYVATSSQGTGDGLSQANATTLADLKTNAPAFKYGGNIAGALLLHGATINYLGDETAYSDPIGTFNTNGSAPKHSYSIVGGVGGGTTTFTTTSSATFNNAQATINISNITFSGCTSESPVNVSAGKVSFSNCSFSSNTAANGGALAVGSTSATDANLNVSFTNVVFSNNAASSGNGGAIYVTEGSTGGIVSFNNCLFNTNTVAASSKSGGAAYENNGKTALLFNNCSFTGNNAKSNGIVIYVNNANGRLGMNNCTINGGSAVSGKSNGALVTNKGLNVIANSTFWSKDGYGAWGLIALGASGTANGSSVVNCLVRNGTATDNTNNYPAFACNTNYYQNVQWCVYTGASGVGPSPANVVSPEKHTFANSLDLGVTQGQLVTNAQYKNKAMSGVTQYYYTWTNDLAEAGFTKPTETQIRNIIAKTAESAADAMDGFGKLFLDWLDEVGGLDTDIIGTTRPDVGFKPGSVE